MSKIASHIEFALMYLGTLITVVAVLSFVPIVNILAWICGGLLLLFYPFLHTTLFNNYTKEQAQKAEELEIKKWKHKKELSLARKGKR